LACEQAGYREQEHGYLAVWLCHTFGVALDLMYGPLAE
jgi:hypothetical protein